MEPGCPQSLQTTKPSHNSDILSFHFILWAVENWQGFFKQRSSNLCRKITLKGFEKIEQSWERLNPKQEEGTAGTQEQETVGA